VNVILDIVGAPYLNRNLEVLAMDGRIFILGMQDGFLAEVNIAPLMKKNITIICKW
jgi:NADPH:quinone reductase-like Zn-dependent oxidoreductase